jgi:drug/metabolite transporter (DMT)-like permease
VPLDALVLVLVAAVAHALWNLLAKGGRGGPGFVWLAAAISTVLYVPALAIALAVDPGRLGLVTLGFMALSGLLHAVYFTSLQRGYATGDLGLVYPLARGTGPLIATVLALVIFAERPSAVTLLGGAIILGAVLSLVGSPRRWAGGEHRAAIGFALLTGLTIASYTLWDKQAVDGEGLSPVVYYWGTSLANVAVLTAVVAGRRADARLAWTTSRARALGVGILSPLAYVLVLFALARAPVASVAPARETSILIATILGATVLGEGEVGRRLVAGAGIVLGIAALAVG